MPGVWLAWLAAGQRLIAASLMGSALSARFRPDSDVDVALLPKHGPRPLRRVAETRWQDLVQFCREIQIKIQP